MIPVTTPHHAVANGGGVVESVFVCDVETQLIDAVADGIDHMVSEMLGGVAIVAALGEH